jgi:CspA family cold shock protein
MTKVKVVSFTGVVKFFAENKGYGFIIPDDSAMRDVFFHQTNTNGKLVKDDKVIFEVEESKRGLKAVNVQKM